jgi:hypothetical protein
MPGISASKIAIPFGRSQSWSGYWKTQSEFYELWKVTGAGTMTGLKRGDSLTITGSGLNAIYAVPDTNAYKTIDTDYVFHKSDGSVSTLCDGNRLIAYDFSKIIVKYLDIAPYTIEYIGILDTGKLVNNKMRDDFHLSIWWDNTLSAYGNLKQNRPLSQQYIWTPEVSIPTGLTLSLISGGVKIDWTTGDVTAQTEIWGKNDNDAYALLYTINAGVVTKSETINPVDLRYYKVRAKKGAGYSDFTAEQSIAMLGAEIITPNGLTLSFWNYSPAACWSSDGAKLSCNGSGQIARLSMLTAGYKYRAIKTVVHSGGYVTGPASSDNANDYDSTSGTFVKYVVAAGVHLSIYASSFVGDITYLSFKRILNP